MGQQQCHDNDTGYLPPFFPTEPGGWENSTDWKQEFDPDRIFSDPRKYIDFSASMSKSGSWRG